MRDGDFHINVLKRLDDLESTSASTYMIQQLENTVALLEERVNDLESKLQEAVDAAQSLRDIVYDLTDRTL